MHEITQICPVHTENATIDRGVIRKRLDVTFQAGFDIVPSRIEPAPVVVSVEEYIHNTEELAIPPIAALDPRHEIATYATASTEARHRTSDLIAPHIPIGEHGPALASHLLTGTVRTINTIEQSYPDLQEIAVATPDRQATLRYHTFQGIEREDSAAALVINMQQGVLAAAQALALLSVQEVPGYDGERLVQELVDRDLVTQLARAIGSGVVSQLVRHGQTLESPLIVRDGSVHFSTALKAYTDKTREVSRQKAIQARQSPSVHDVTDAITHLLAYSGTTCPAANRGRQIQQSARLVLDAGRLET